MGSLGARSERVPSGDGIRGDTDSREDSVVVDLRHSVPIVSVQMPAEADPDPFRLSEPSIVRAVGPREHVLAGRVFRTAKRTFDLVVSGLSLVLLLPLFLTVVIAIKLDDGGPVYFLQERVGHRGKLFRIVKFRTMEPDSDESVHREHTARLFEAPGALRIADDPRITRVGNRLRRWSLDELPNLLNVLRGQMSLVGPRPLVPYEVAYLSPEQRRRLEVKPGITGLAQINGRLWLRPNDRTSLDIDYVDNQSFWLDVVVIAKTVPALRHMRG